MEQRIQIEGMTCGGCAASVKRAVGAVPGVQSVEIDLPGKAATVVWDEADTDLPEIKAAIEGAGYDVVG